MWSSRVQLVVSVLLTVTIICQAHVSLTYPPARTYAIDFLDNARTVAPCGMAKGRSNFCVWAYCTVYCTWSLVLTPLRSVVEVTQIRHSEIAVEMSTTIATSLILRYRLIFTIKRFLFTSSAPQPDSLEFYLTSSSLLAV